jgi:SAM-dependent methyltransferase
MEFAAMPELGLRFALARPDATRSGYREGLRKLFQPRYVYGCSGAAIEFRRRAGSRIQSAYIAYEFNYGDGAGKLLRWLLALPILLSRIKCDELDIPMRYLAVPRKGRILDVGCGNGSILKLAQDLGWDTKGVDFDSHGVETARRRGLSVRMGRLTDQRYAEGSFDLVVMGHVIEHVHRPLGTLAENPPGAAQGRYAVSNHSQRAEWGAAAFWVQLRFPRSAAAPEDIQRQNAR